MDMDLITFTYAALTGVSANAAYDSIKQSLGTAFYRFEKLAKTEDKDSFNEEMQLLLEQDEEVKQQLKDIQQGNNTRIKQSHSGSGDNVAGDKTVNIHK